MEIFNAQEEEKIREMSKKENVFDLLANKIAPNIYGYQDIKKAILC